MAEKFARELALKEDVETSAEIQKISNAIAQQLTGLAFSARLAKAMGLAFGDLIAALYNDIKALEGRA